jgi:hypothetical protein
MAEAQKSLKQRELLEAGSQRTPLGTVIPLPFYVSTEVSDYPHTHSKLIGTKN